MEMKSNEEKIERVLLAGVHTGCRDLLKDTTEESIAELAELAKTAGAEVVGVAVQNKPDLEAATYMGTGKLEEIKTAILELKVDTVIFDDELSPIQLRNIADFLGVKVIDRTILILDIFALRAKSGEGKLQVELAQLKYRLPRLRGFGTQMSRTGGGIGTRGPGETKLESDRRHINRRITALTEEIKEIKKHRDVIRARREKDGTITCCLVGYTNAGKSSLLNRLTNADVLAEDKLFATLDTTARGLTLSDNRKILMTDTVGFIRKLPHHLVEAFKTTLEETVVADFLVHVIDCSNPQYEDHIKVVNEVLGELGAAGKPTIYAYNKIDLSDNCDEIAPCDTAVFISAKSGKNIDKLLETIEEVAPGKKQKICVLVPYDKGSIVSNLHQNQKILKEEYTEKGTKIELLADAVTYDKLREYIQDEMG